MKPLSPEKAHALALRGAAYASLQGSASSEEARALVDDVSDRVVAYELEHGGRQNQRRGAQLEKLKKATGAFLADLLTVHAGKHPSEWVYRPLKAEAFTQSTVSYRTFTALWEALEGLGLIEHREGVNDWAEEIGKGQTVVRRRASRFRATTALLRLSQRHGVPSTRSADHFSMGLPKEPLLLRAATAKNGYGHKLRGRPMKFEHTTQTEKLKADVQELNEFLSKQEISGGIHQGYVRIFQNGDDPAFKWNMGGRLYSEPGGRNYQELNERRRLEMTINGEPVSEIDIRASYLTIFHAWHDVQLDLNTDPYAVPDIGNRAVVKAWINALFGAGKPPRQWSPKMQEDFQKRSGKPLDRKRYPISKVTRAVLEHYPLLEKWGQPRRGRVKSWADLMYLESVVVVSTMLDLMREREVPSLAMHDGLIIPQSKVKMATKALKARFRWATKMEPQITISSKQA